MATNPMLALQGLIPPGAMPPMAPPPAANMFGAGLPQLPALIPPQPPLPTISFGDMNPVNQPTPAIDKLRPESEEHKVVREKLDAMIKFSRGEMEKHYHRWNMNEQKVQAYTYLTDYKRVMEELGNSKNPTPPQPISIIVPYSYATLHAAGTFISSVLLGRKPVFPLMATRGTEADRARNMESALQSHLDASRGQETLWQLIWDSGLYGFGTVRNVWEERQGEGIRLVGGERQMVNELTFAGNVTSAVDPYAFYPDPRVPIHQVNIKGDFIFTEVELSEISLLDMEKAGSLKWVKEGLEKRKRAGYSRDNSKSQNRRRVRLGVNGQDPLVPHNVIGFHALKEGTVRIVPKDWKLGDSDRSELWKFMWFEGGQIVQAEPLGMIHNQHPYASTEPTSFGHDFMSLSSADMIGPFQEIISWLVSSRMENVRAAVQNSFIADPARVEVNDIRSSAIGRIIRLKQTAMGLPIKDAIMQLQMMDVTAGHFQDIQTMRILADTITGVNDNMRGVQNQGGRRSATEARISMQAGGSRLSQQAIRMSSQALHPLAGQMISNIQQFMPENLWIETTGDAGAISTKMTVDMLMGSFNYQISDGTLPFDKTALVEVWKEILMGVAQDPELRQGHDINKIFDYVAELGGAKNIDSFKKQQMLPPTGAMANPGADPNMMPLGPAMPTNPIPAGAFGP